MRRRDWIDRLGDWLPGDARDWYRPSIEDLRHLDAERGPHALSSADPTWRRLRFAVSALSVYADCLRLSAADRLRAAIESIRRLPAVLRKEPASMVLQDVRRTLRLFIHEPSFAFAAMLTLALGIGANTALFAVVDAVLLKPLPFAAADDLVVLQHRDRATGLTKPFIAIGDFVDLRDSQHALEGLAGYGFSRATLRGGPEPIRITELTVTPDFFTTLRIQPALGRLFDASAAREGAAPVALISYELWRTRFGSDPNIVSQSIQVNDTRVSVVGVAPAGFQFPAGQPTDLIVPLPVPVAAPAQRKDGWIFALGRLRTPQTLAQATTEFDALSRRFEERFPDQNRGSQYFVAPLRDVLVGDTKRPLLLLLGAVAIVLLIACVNVGNLLLARGVARRSEMAVRIALGAGTTRLVMQILTEALVLALAGGAAGLIVAWAAVPVLASLLPADVAVLGLDRIGINIPVLLFSMGASLVAALLFGGISCVSLLGSSRPRAQDATRRSTRGAGARRFASTLVVVEIAMAVVLLIGAGLTLRSFGKLLTVDPGFRTANVLTVQLQLPAGRYETPESREAFYARAFTDLRLLPGVNDVGAAVVTPLTGNNWTTSLQRPEFPVPAGERPPEVGWQSASGGYFSALNIPLRAGRLFNEHDVASAPPVVIISEQVARRYFPNENPIGRRVGNSAGPAEIIGVVGDIRRASLTDEPRADMYFPFERDASSNATMFVRMQGDPLRAFPAVRATLRRIEPEVVADEARTLENIANASAVVTRMAMRLFVGFAVMALLLAAIGIYGVVAYSVRGRTRELGTRVALGAGRGQIVRLVMRQAVVMTTTGVGTGLIAGIAAARLLSTVLYDVPPTDPATLAGSVVLLTATALGASYLPARAAARLDPARTLAAD
ncbi:MAG: ABC transporter permease [Acidobacteriota bacterium]